MPRRALFAALVFTSCLAPVAGRGRDAAAVIRTMAGVRYLVPAGWDWTAFDGTSLTLLHGGSQFTVDARAIPDDAPEKHRLDGDARRTFPGGATAVWTEGARLDGGHDTFSGEITVGSRVLSVSTAGTASPAFDPRLVEAAFIAIAESARAVPDTTTIYHPARGFAADRLPSAWHTNVSGFDIAYGCMAAACGPLSDTLAFAYPSEYPDVAAALADITGFFRKRAKLKIGPARHQDFPGGAVVWTEQPGSAHPFIGVARRDGLNYVVVMSGRATTRDHETLRTDFLAIATSVRTWNGQ